MSVTKYFTTTVKPIMLPVKMNSGAYADDDVLFDFQPFEIPRGTNRLVGATALVRGNDGVAQELPFDLVFASRNTHSLGTEHATANGAPNPYLLGIMGFKASDYGQKSLDVMSIATARENRSNLCITGDHTYAGNSQRMGFDRVYVGGLAGGAFNFASTVAVTAQHTAGASTVLTLDGKSAELVLAEGDTIRADDNALIGTIKSVDSGTQITLEEANISQIEDGDEMYNISPIHLILHFER